MPEIIYYKLKFDFVAYETDRGIGRISGELWKKEGRVDRDWKKGRERGTCMKVISA